MRLEEFDYELPGEAVAQAPLPRRDSSRLLRLRRDGGAIAHHRFDELPRLLRRGDLLVVNDTRVVPARLAARKPSGGQVELLLVERLPAAPDDGPEEQRWRCLGRASRPPRPGARLSVADGLSAELLERRAGDWILRLSADDGEIDARLRAAGSMPLPPYIRREPGCPAPVDDRERYQTIFAAHDGAVAAPTAGLHFTTELTAALAQAGIGLARITLHVGPGTFLPVRSERIEEHVMHEEFARVDAAAAESIAAARRAGGRIVAVGTTAVRTLESRVDEAGHVCAGEGRTGLFIYPGFRFRAVDAMITNFHLPRSTLLMLVAAFAGREALLASYRAAVGAGYRFYSYGDAMLVD